MGYALPSGVINTDSAYFFADSTLALGPLVKQLSEQTLVIVDYSQVTTDLTGYDFTIDVSSNPALVISYPDLDATGSILTFLISGGITGQQYKISIMATMDINTRTDVLTINIPSSSGDCVQINPVPQIYTQLPVGEPTQGYVNTGVRYFWGAAPPANPNVMDQWYDPTTDTLSEWVTDGTTFFWETMASVNLVTEAALDSVIYGRYNGVWVPEPIQLDAPADGRVYGRWQNGWTALPTILPVPPNDGYFYAWFNGSWEAVPIQRDAPIGGLLYGRTNGVWTALTPSIPDAPSTGLLYSRVNTNWLPTPVQTDAPNDGRFYARNNNAWLPILVNTFLTDAPSDGTLYGRVSGTWGAAYPASNPANYQTLAQVGAAVALMMPRAGGNFTGAIGAPGYVMPNGPGSLQISGGQAGQILAALNNNSNMTWIPAPPAEAPLDGIAYARQNGVWVATASGAGVPEAPSDGTAYVRRNAAWTQLDTTDIADWASATSAMLAPYALITMVPLGSITFPPMDGTQAIGTSLNWARADHVHPTDTSLYPASNPSNYQTAAQVTAALVPYALVTSVPVASNAAPNMDGVVSPGGSAAFSRADHVHPSDTSRLALMGGTMTGVLTLVGNPVGNLDAAPKQYVDTAVSNGYIDCGTF